ncbi:Mitogen-activated protein kinase 16 [Morella rubra]|uniref:mitogen-activated protein kinase n=1 Tax=Morella rubra TaxID=262757 RepID=A0A6A1VMR1_9ROSI|nr:Mitogen-activated protein kinase 16 [Morella rubra]
MQPDQKRKSSVDVDFFTEYGEGSRYRIEEVIGKGSYGVVCSAYDTHTGEKVAIKKINDIFEHVSDATRILREIKLLRLLRHPDIVEIKHILLPPSRREFKDIYVVFELMESDLHQVIKANDDLTPEHYQFFLYQLLRGLKYIHTANVFHRDLKPKNILANADCKLKICDFGLARVAFNDTPTAIFWTDYVATRWYRAPELCGSFFSKIANYAQIMFMESSECTCLLFGSEMSLFNRCFRIESKEFHVRISAKGDLLFSEWSSRTVNEIHMGKYGAVWMVNMSDKLLVASHAVDFASKFTESRRGFLAQRCCNKGGRYIAVVEYGGRRKLGAVLVPEGKHGHGWQILNRVFLEAVSCFRSASLSVTRVESSRIRPEDSFAKVVLAPAVVHDDGGRSSAPVQISRVADTSNTVYMQQNPEVGPLPKLISSSMSKEHAEEGKCPAGLSDREALSLNGADLGKQVMSLRKEVDRLASLLRQQCQGGFSFPALSCSVCGFTLKAQQARAHPPCQFIGRAFGLPCGGPNFGAGDSGVSLGKGG